MAASPLPTGYGKVGEAVDLAELELRIGGRIADLRNELVERMDERFDKVDERFNAIDQVLRNILNRLPDG